MAEIPHTTYVYGVGPGTVTREDLMDMISIIDPWETPFFVATPKVEASSVTVEWLTHTLPATSTAGACEGADYGAAVADAAAPSRTQNVCQIFRSDFKVSNTLRAVNLAGAQDWYQFEVQRNLKAIARNVEITSLRLSAASAVGTTATAREMKPFGTFLSTNVEHANSVTWGTDYGAGSSASATIMSEDRFNVMLEHIFNSGGNPDTAYVSMPTKRHISDFSGMGASRRNIAMAEKRLIASVDVYDSDTGLISIVADRWVVRAANTTIDHETDQLGEAYFVETPMNQYAILRPIRHVPLDPLGDATVGMIVGELTLKVINEKAHGKYHGIANVGA